jgi:hypothetical protein
MARSRLLDILLSHSTARQVLCAPEPNLGLAHIEPFADACCRDAPGEGATERSLDKQAGEGNGSG